MLMRVFSATFPWDISAEVNDHDHYAGIERPVRWPLRGFFGLIGQPVCYRYWDKIFDLTVRQRHHSSDINSLTHGRYEKHYESSIFMTILMIDGWIIALCGNAIGRHWSSVQVRHQTINWAYDDLTLCRHMASQGNGFVCVCSGCNKRHRLSLSHADLIV